jgi:tetratricopeptide (TPR) repeat protein
MVLSFVRNRRHVRDFPSVRRLDDAVRQQEHALKADPFSVLNQYFMARLLVYLGDFARAAEHAAQAMELAPRSWLAHGALGFVHLRAGRVTEALACLDRVKSAAPAAFITTGWRGCAYVLAGQTEMAERLLRELQQTGAPVPAAMIHAQLGNTDAAFDQLETAVRGRDFQLYNLQVDPGFDSLRSQPRYLDLLRAMKLQMPRGLISSQS